MSRQPFPRPITGMTLYEMRRALENISGECCALARAVRATEAVLFTKTAQYAEEARACMVRVIEDQSLRIGEEETIGGERS